jgi:tryptophanyl-tRNA synthetase
MKQRIFSGIQPTGNLHIGNYLGAIRQWVNLQNQSENIFCIVDLHAITVAQDPQVLRAKTREVAALLFAAGIEPDLSSVFIQSHISAHAELAWILNCYIPMGRMQRMTQFKEKSQKQRETVSVGLFDYPALMAADILLYESDFVPVGEDQKQHVELTRDIARRFNLMHGEIFKIPEPIVGEVGARIMSLEDPTKKMSKSETGTAHAINLLDSPDVIRLKIMKATTDSLRNIQFDPNRPAVYNLLTIYELFSGLSRTDIEKRFDGKGYAVLKQELADVVIESLKPLQWRYQKLANEPSYIDRLLTEGASHLRPIAQKTLSRVKDAIGLG